MKTSTILILVGVAVAIYLVASQKTTLAKGSGTSKTKGIIDSITGLLGAGTTAYKTVATTGDEEE